MWDVDIDQAVEMYARFCRARYGARAGEMIERNLRKLHKAGDSEGVKVWERVKDAVGTTPVHRSFS